MEIEGDTKRIVPQKSTSVKESACVESDQNHSTQTRGRRGRGDLTGRPACGITTDSVILMYGKKPGEINA